MGIEGTKNKTMKYINGNILCLEYDELVPLIIKRDNYHFLKGEGKLTVHGRGGNGSKVLIEYEKTPKKYKDAIVKHYGCPYQYQAKQPVLALIHHDFEAEKFYNDYKLESNLSLPEAYVSKYTHAASWLNAITHLTTNKRALKSHLNISVTAFWELATELIRIKNIHLPTSEKRLKDKIKAYNVPTTVNNVPYPVNYACFIESWRFANGNSKKVKDEVAEALLKTLVGHNHQFDYTVIATKYNQWAIQNQRKTITAGAVKYFHKINFAIVDQERYGKANYYNQNVKQVHRDRASCPLAMIGSDDNVLDLYFKNETYDKATGKKTVNHYYRPVLYVVMDTYNDYPLGYAIGETVTIELIQMAYLNAMHHIKEITGEFYLPHQLQMDRWGLDPKMAGTLATFYNSIGHTTPATAKVAQGKYIERAFGTQWHQTLKEFKSYSGYNITAKNRLSLEAIDGAKKDFPDKADAPIYVQALMNELRKPRLNAYLTAFNAPGRSKERLLTTEKRLQTFGTKRIDKDGKPITNAITTAGLKAKIGGQEIVYDVPEQYYPYQVGKKMQLLYDPYDLTTVLATDGKGLRFVASQYQNMPSALIDFKPGDRTRLNSLLEGKKTMAAVPGIAKENNKAILERAHIDAQSFLQGGSLVKEIRQLAERSVQGYMALPEAIEANEYTEYETVPNIYDRM